MNSSRFGWSQLTRKLLVTLRHMRFNGVRLFGPESADGLLPLHRLADASMESGCLGRSQEVLKRVAPAALPASMESGCLGRSQEVGEPWIAEEAGELQWSPAVWAGVSAGCRRCTPAAR